MSDRRSFLRKIGYVVAIAALLFPLTMLSRPSAGGAGQGQAVQGGKLARLRQQYNLSQSSLGEIDPASETMKLATLGMRGVAANLLWEKANYYKKIEDWTNFAATLEQITKLQPNFISVWQYQGWNLSYNLSVEFDDYHDRYMYVIRGINFLKEGEKVNKDEPRLLWDIGWFISHKIGRADEAKQYRRLFKEDPDFHVGTNRTKAQKDNWLVGKEWFDRAVAAVDFKGKRLRGKNPLIFYSNGPMALISYAEALQADGVHGVPARLAWRSAADEWKKYSNRNILTSFGFRIVLSTLERTREEAEKYHKQLDELVAGARDKVAAQKRLSLTDEERAILNTPEDDRSSEQMYQMGTIQRKLEVGNGDVAAYITEQKPALAKKAARLARLADQTAERARVIDSYRDQVNYNYWNVRCQFEQTADVLAARELVYLGDQALKEGADLIKGKKLYDEGLARWKAAFDRYPQIAEEGTLVEDLIDTVLNYHQLLNELDEPMPRDFPLRNMVLAWDRDNRLKGIFPYAVADVENGAEEEGLPSEGRPPEPKDDEPDKDAQQPAPKAEKPAEKPAETPAEKAAEKPADKSADKAADKPAAKPAETTPAKPEQASPQQ